MPTFWSVKVKVEVLSVRKAWLTPAPVRLTALPFTVSVPGKDAAEVGVKVGLIVHSLPAARLAPQVSVSV